MKPDTEGNLTCNVCGEAWPRHGVGGDCKVGPLVYRLVDGEWVLGR
jgi:hypothetical protein